MYGISDVSDIGIGIGIGYPIFHLEKIGYRYRVRISYRTSPAINPLMNGVFIQECTSTT